MAKQLGTTGEFFRRRDEWRKHPMLSKQMRHAVPGLGLGVAAFVVYCIGEFAINKLLSSDVKCDDVLHTCMIQTQLNQEMVDLKLTRCRVELLVTATKCLINMTAT
ncbi:NADH dehydrogenase [ubiquinone] 1 beta subcomplex subunit 3 [Dillenia turbinata]|uniref:NADH dehydrogenase [ubiquinone] 1 beta subcomplex subunit 3 n=1 Tax=Dillenia turbinata TaxID=194707 RepID=A0AAN8UQX3_9MAGN